MLISSIPGLYLSRRKEEALVIIRLVETVDLGKEYAKPVNDVTMNPTTEVEDLGVILFFILPDPICSHSSLGLPHSLLIIALVLILSSGHFSSSSLK